MRNSMLTAFVGLILAGTATAATLFVRPDGSGDYPTIQEAIWGSVDGDVIELADGVFVGDGNRRVVFGGRAVTLRSASGDPARCVVDIQATPDKQEFGFAFVDGEGNGSRMEHLTIINGLDLGC